MRIAVVSCWKYRDAWTPMMRLLDKFWPDCSDIDLITDELKVPWPSVFPARFYFATEKQWCATVREYANEYASEDGILILQEDMFLNAPVNTELVEHGLEILKRENVGAVRLYPCPGATTASYDPYFGMVEPHTQYRTSCQATIWKPEYLHAIASRFSTPAEFELLGSSWASANRTEEVWAFKREVQPWPLSYFCSAISRGLWEPAALEFCRQHGIEVDTSMRRIASNA